MIGSAAVVVINANRHADNEYEVLALMLVIIIPIALMIVITFVRYVTYIKYLKWKWRGR